MTEVFAPFGNTPYFYEKGYNSNLEMPGFLNKLGLNGYEYSLDEGIHISDDSCEILKNEALKYGITLSVYSGKLFFALEDSVALAEKIGAKRVVVPLGNCAIKSRKSVYEDTLLKMKDVLLKYRDIYLYPELMGLIHDLGTLDEVLKLSQEDERIIPAINFPNLFARNLGKDIDYENILKKVINKIGKEKADKLHIYLSNVVFTNQGFKSYSDFSDETENNFKFEPVIDAIKKLNIKPFIVCRCPYDCYRELNLIKDYYEREQINCL